MPGNIKNVMAAITIIIYTHFLLSSFYIGFSMGVAPVISYNYGKQDEKQLKFLRTFGLITVLLLTLPNVLGVTGVWLAVPITEQITMIVALVFLHQNREEYHYAQEEAGFPYSPASGINSKWSRA